MRIGPLVCCFVLLAGPVHAGICKTQDLMPEYFAFEAKAKTLPLEARTDLFVKDIVAAHPDFYTEEEFGDAAKIRKSAARFLDDSKPIMLGSFGPLTDEKLHAVAANVMPAFDKAQTDFANT